MIRVNWKFLHYMFRRMGFGMKWFMWMENAMDQPPSLSS